MWKILAYGFTSSLRNTMVPAVARYSLICRQLVIECSVTEVRSFTSSYVLTSCYPVQSVPWFVVVFLPILFVTLSFLLLLLVVPGHWPKSAVLRRAREAPDLYCSGPVKIEWARARPNTKPAWGTRLLYAIADAF